MTTIATRVRPGKTLNLDDGKDLSDMIHQWSTGLIDLDAVLKFLEKTSLDRRHLASGVVQKGQLINAAGNHHDDDIEFQFYQPKGKASLRLLSLLLENPRTRTAAVSSIWEESPQKDQFWVINVCKHLSDRAVYSLLTTKPDPAAVRGRAENILPGIAQSVTTQQKDTFLTLAKKHRKMSGLYAATGWEECRALASEKERSELLESDLGM